MSHTPGPWEAAFGYAKSHGDSREIVRADIESKNGTIGSTKVRPGLDAVANAHLIAAAPDLLEALELIASARERGFDIHYAEGCARAAIRNARGES